ncbi:MAG: ABC transporter ATP-binding protein [Myxococcota bacterium]
MKLFDFGFDLAGYREPRLRRGLILSSVGAVVDTLPLLVAVWMLDLALRGGGAPVAVAAGALALLFVLGFGLRSVASLDNFIATYALVGRTRIRLADHLRRLPMGFFSRRRVGSLASVLTDEFGLYTELATHAWGLTVANIAMPTTIAFVMAFVDWRVALIAFAPVPLALLALPWSTRRVQRASDSLDGTRKTLVADLVEYVQGLRTLVGLGAEKDFVRRIRTSADRVADAQMKAELAPAPAVLAYGFLVHSGFVAVLSVSAWWIPPASFARWVLAVLVAAHFARVLSELVFFISAIRYADRTVTRVRALFETPAQPEGKGAMNMDADAPAMALRNVCFGYDEAPVLKDIDLRFEQGHVTALVGPSGCGKSTVLSLLTRLWDVDEGAVELFGSDVRSLPLSKVQQSVATVSQTTTLFEGTVLENVRLGAPGAELEAVDRALRSAGAWSFVEALPDGIHTVLGPDGGGLSGGQRQRLAIARALLADAPILLLDEATASVDPEQEHAIQQAIARLAEGRTVVVVSHRLWTVRDADRIVVMEDGQVAEAGTHDALLAQGGPYASLWQAQEEAASWSF